MVNPPFLLVEDGVFGGNTSHMVKLFQKKHTLIIDGIVGKFTYSALFFVPWNYTVLKPPFVRQRQWTCWAASLESFLKNVPGRPKLNVDSLLRNYDRYLLHSNSISIAGIKKIAVDLRLHGVLPYGGKISQFVYGEYMYKILRNGVSILVFSLSAGAIGHARILYGVEIYDGDVYLLFMDPMEGYTKELVRETRNIPHLYFMTIREVPPIR